MTLWLPKSEKNSYRKTKTYYEKLVVPFGFRGLFFDTFRTRIPLGHQSPKMYEKGHQKAPQRSPTGHQNDARNQKHATRIKHKIGLSVSRNPARRNARSV